MLPSILNIRGINCGHSYWAIGLVNKRRNINFDFVLLRKHMVRPNGYVVAYFTTCDRRDIGFWNVDLA